MIYIKEAHPSDGARPKAKEGKQLAINIKQGIKVKQPKTFEARKEVAQTCSTKLDIKFPILVDDLDNKTCTAYSAFPDRLYILAPNGTIAYKSAPGPKGFKVQEIATELDKLQAK